MTGLRSFVLGATTVAALSLFNPAAKAIGCPFCSAQGQTLSGEVNQADFIVLGTLSNAQRDKNDFTRGTTDLSIEIVVKPHDFLTGKTKLVIPRYVPIEPKGNGKFLLFCSLYTRQSDFAAAAVSSTASLATFSSAQIDAYRGEMVRQDSKLAEYLKGAIEVRGKDSTTRLRYFFDYLDSNDLVIASDALNEFGYADYKEVRDLAATIPSAKVLKWLTDPNTSPSRFGLYGLLLGHCGKKEDAKTLHALLTQPDRAYSSGLDGMLAAYVLLDKEAGWNYAMGLLKDPKNDFPIRYAGLKLMRFFYEFRPDVVPQKEVIEGMKLLAGQADMADLPIEDLRKWGQWQLTPFVLAFTKEQSHNSIPIVRRSILRFAIAAPANQTEAKAYVEEIRKQDPDRVKFVEQTLQDELPTKPNPPMTAGATPSGPGGK